MDSLISGRQARSVRSTPTRVTDACRLDPVGVHQRPTTGGQLRVRPVPRLPPALGHYLFTTRCPPHPTLSACAVTRAPAGGPA
ncbi:hypothetical protein EVAR_61570_1 [Eumeta japonica]|uniref:Uncharacterized protein n=1 Tax=Eumeta variegata TaxID=151549 RepID=A0A4C1YV67_EUMVA|nr:hypothetical protein EVAR_61570_1 [Eumeta japonica]